MFTNEPILPDGNGDVKHRRVDLNLYPDKTAYEFFSNPSSTKKPSINSFP
jgi:hypothetical protein